MSFWKILLILIVLSVGYFVVLEPTFRTTTSLGVGEFRKIELDSDKSVTNIVLVHGIGHHCIGYGDVFIRNLLKLLANQEQPVSLDELSATVKWDELYRVNDSSTSRPGPIVPGPMLDGGCVPGLGQNGDTSKTIWDFFGRDVDQRIDYDFLTTAQDLLCEAIHDHSHQDVDCYQLYVEVPTPSAVSPLDKYITGFVRRVQINTNLSPSHTIHVYELTWSPATRWIKKLLGPLESANERDSDHMINRAAKARITNAAFPDALAYLSDNGVLINYSVLQTVCMAALSDSHRKDFPYEFTCLPEHLELAANYSNQNSVFLLSHSLGTQVLLDSLGMMAHGIREQRNGGVSDEACHRPGYLQLIRKRLKRIGAQMPEWRQYMCVSDRLLSAVEQFINSVKSIYAFTNQLPLFAVNTSPFHFPDYDDIAPDYDIAPGFQEFLNLRENSGTSSAPLEIVSFHDPDDVLSYNLYCWYRQSVARHFPAVVRNAINGEIMPDTRAAALVIKADLVIKRESRKLRDRLFTECRRPEDRLVRTDPAVLAVLAQINDTLEKMGDVRIIDASLRVESFRFRGLLADPVTVHSNYFTNPTLPTLLVN